MTESNKASNETLLGTAHDVAHGANGAHGAAHATPSASGDAAQGANGAHGAPGAPGAPGVTYNAAPNAPGTPSAAPSTASYEYTTFPRQFLSYRWFKPLLVLLLGFVFMLIFQIVLILMCAIATGNLNIYEVVGTGYDDMDSYSGPGALLSLGGVAVMLPALALAALIVRDRPYSSYSSSRGGWNWAAFVKCILVAIVVMSVFTLIQILIPMAVHALGLELSPTVLSDVEPTGVSRFTTIGLIFCVVLVPFQSVAEEYVFRGLCMQAVASWTKLPVLGILVSAVIFAIGHSYNLIGLIAIFFNGIIFSLLAWRTRGLEASSALHIVNNMIAFLGSGFGLSPVTSEIDIFSLVIDIITCATFLAAIFYADKKWNWFTSKGDGAAAYNERILARRAQKEARKAQRALHGGAPEPVVASAPEPVTASASNGAPQPIVTPAPVGAPQPVAAPVPAGAPEPVIAPASAGTPEPVTTQHLQEHPNQ